MALGDKTMKPEDIAPIETPSRHPGFKTNTSPRKDAAAIPQNAVKTDGVKIPSIERIQLNKLQNSKSQYHGLAHQIRELNQTMEAIDVNLEKMRKNLESIIKIYPPYPPGSAERVESLRQFSALRKMIDQLAPAQDDHTLDNFLAQPKTRSLMGKGEVGAGDFKRHSISDANPVPPGTGDLDIPELSLESSDQDIHSALNQTLAAQRSMAARRDAFAAAANLIISQIT